MTFDPSSCEISGCFSSVSVLLYRVTSDLELGEVGGFLPALVVSHLGASWEADGYAVCRVLL